MNTEQIKDMHLLYNAVYNEELREQFEEYNNTIYDEDIVEVATEYFYSYGLNADGIDILIENVGLESFVEYVYELSEDLILTEARKVSKAKKQPGSLRSRQQEKLAAQRAASGKKEEERTQPESRGAESEAKAEQPKSKKPERKSIADRISNAIKSGVERHNKATATAGRLAGETGKTLGKLAKGVGSVAGQVGSGAGTVGKVSKKVLFGEEVDLFDYILEHLVTEGYADTNESALVIMANMSEDWRGSIVEGIAGRAANAVGHQRAGTLGDDDEIRKNQDATSASIGKLKRGSGAKVTPTLPGV
jgi:hypothetical protein